MAKNIRNDSIFKKPFSTKNIKSKKISKTLNKDNKTDFKNFYLFSLASLILIFSFFSLPYISSYLSENFVNNQTVINVSKKNFEIAYNKKNTIVEEKSTNLEDVFNDIDVFSSEQKITNTSRLSASTIEQNY
jgi:hypothetical protein